MTLIRRSILLYCLLVLFPSLGYAQLAGWNWRKSHVMTGSSVGVVTNYPMKMTVHAGSGSDSVGDVYCTSLCKSDFSDVRFTASDGTTLLSYWLERKIDSSYALFNVNIPSVPASPGTLTIYMYYNNTIATSTSNGTTTFPVLYDDFDLKTAPRALVAADGAVTSISTLNIPSGTGTHPTRPHGVFYNGVTYLAYASKKNPTNFGIKVLKYTHATDTISSPVVIEADAGSTDIHTYPGIQIDNSGYLYITIAYENPGGALRQWRSNNPEDISAWTKTTLDSSLLIQYPEMYTLANNNLFLFYRYNQDGSTGGSNVAWQTSTDNGATFGARTILAKTVTGDRLYKVAIRGSDDSVHIAWTHDRNVGGNQQYKDIFYAKSLDGGATWKDAAGSTLTLPLDAATQPKVVTTATADFKTHTYVKDIALDENQSPVLLYFEGTTTLDFDASTISTWVGTSQWKIAYYSGGWQTSTISSQQPGKNWGVSGALVVRAHNDIDAYIGPHPQPTTDYLGNVEKHHFDGSTWTLVKTISTYNFGNDFVDINFYISPIYKANSALEVLWSNGAAEPTAIYGYGSAETFNNGTFSAAYPLGNFYAPDLNGTLSVAGGVLNSTTTTGQNFSHTLSYVKPQTDASGGMRLAATFTPTFSGTTFRFATVGWQYQPEDLANGTHDALYLRMTSDGWTLLWKPTDGGTLAFTSLSATVPVTGHVYRTEMAHYGSVTYVSIYDVTSDVSVYSGNTTTANWGSTPLYPTLDSWATPTTGTQTALWDDYVIAQYVSPEPVNTSWGTAEAVTTAVPVLVRYIANF